MQKNNIADYKLSTVVSGGNWEATEMLQWS